MFIISSSFGRKKLDKTGFIQFFPFCPEETGFGRKKTNPAEGPVSIQRRSFPDMGIPMLKTVLSLTWGSLYWKDIFILRRPPGLNTLHKWQFLFWVSIGVNCQHCWQWVVITLISTAFLYHIINAHPQMLFITQHLAAYYRTYDLHSFPLPYLR